MRSLSADEALLAAAKGSASASENKDLATLHAATARFHRYDEVANLESAQRLNNQGNYKLTWEVEERPGHSAYLLIAHGHDPRYLDSYSIKKADQEEVD